MKLFGDIGIKRKVRYGSIVLAVILFFSTLISIFEFVKMNDYVSDVITDNIRSINTARELLSVSEEFNLELMEGLILDSDSDSLETMVVVSNDELISSFDNISKTFLTPEERASADSVVFAYAAFMQIASEADEVWDNSFNERQDWYFNRLQPVYIKFRNYIMTLTSVCQDALIKNSESLQEGFNRSLMPSLVSMLLGLVMVMLFNYFINSCLVNPLLKIKRGISDYKSFGKSYNLTVDTKDELESMNQDVKDIIDINQSYRRNREQEYNL